MKRNIVTLLLVAAMTGTMVVGCGSKADDKTSDTKTEQTDDKKDTEEKKELADDGIPVCIRSRYSKCRRSSRVRCKRMGKLFQRKSCKFRVVSNLPIGG